MKKISLCLITICLLLTFQPFKSIANFEASSTLDVSKLGKSEEATGLLVRLTEINAIDKSNLDPSAKKRFAN